MAERAGAAEAAAQPDIDLSNPAASGGGEGESLVGRNKADRSAVRRARHAAAPGSASAAATQQQVQSSFQPGIASPDVVDMPDEPAVPATSAPASPGRRARAGQAAGAQAGQGPRRRPRLADRHRARTAPSPATTCRPRSRRRPNVDVLAHGSHDVPAGARETREPIKGVRKMMGQAMVGSAFSIPHVTEWMTVDATRTMEFVDRLKGRREFREVRVSPLLVLSRAVMLAMRRTPEINSWWDDDAQEVVYKHYVNLGIAAATPRGLVVPNVEERRPAVVARPGRGAQRADRHRPRGQDAAGTDERRDVHDHQRRCLRRRLRYADHQPRRVRDHVHRCDQAAAVGRHDGARSRSARSPRWP